MLNLNFLCQCYSQFVLPVLSGVGPIIPYKTVCKRTQANEVTLLQRVEYLQHGDSNRRRPNDVTVSVTPPIRHRHARVRQNDTTDLPHVADSEATIFSGKRSKTAVDLFCHENPPPPSTTAAFELRPS